MKRKRKGENDMAKKTNYDIRYSFRIDKDLLEKVIKYCENNNITVSNFIRESLKTGIENGRKQ